MIKRKGDLFTTELKAIGHGVNCAGLMGAGIAKPIREKYPHNYDNYHAACKSKVEPLLPGLCMVNVENGMSIFNMATQARPGRDARYPWVFSAALSAAEQAVKMGLDSIAIPMIGCGIGGLEWRAVENLLDCVEFIVNGSAWTTDVFEWEVWAL